MWNFIIERLIMKTKTKKPIRRIAVIGGLGFIGAALCRRLLESGAKVLVIDSQLFGRRADVLPPHPNLSVQKIDIRDRRRLFASIKKFKPDTISHLAAIAFIPKCVKDPAEALEVHLGGTLNVIDAARAAGVARVHFASSADVYSPNYVVLSEKTTPIIPPADIYGPTKYAGELIFSRFQCETGAHVIITRAFNVYGSNQTNRFLIPSLCEQLNSGANTLELGNLDTERDYIHVDDYVDALMRLMVETSGLVVVNVGSGRRTSVRELIRLCEKILSRKISVISSQKNRRNRTIDRPSWQADLSHIHHLIGWRPHAAVEDGLRRMLKKLKAVSVL